MVEVAFVLIVGVILMVVEYFERPRFRITACLIVLAILISAVAIVNTYDPEVAVMFREAQRLKLDHAQVKERYPDHWREILGIYR